MQQNNPNEMIFVNATFTDVSPKEISAGIGRPIVPLSTSSTAATEIRCYGSDNGTVEATDASAKAVPPTLIIVQQAAKPPEYVGFFYCSIFSAAVCFLPTGLVAAIYAYKANKRHSAGEEQAAESYNQVAIKLILASILIGIGIYVFAIVYKIIS